MDRSAGAAPEVPTATAVSKASAGAATAVGSWEAAEALEATRRDEPEGMQVAAVMAATEAEGVHSRPTYARAPRMARRKVFRLAGSGCRSTAPHPHLCTKGQPVIADCEVAWRYGRARVAVGAAPFGSHTGPSRQDVSLGRGAPKLKFSC